MSAVLEMYEVNNYSIISLMLDVSYYSYYIAGLLKSLHRFRGIVVHGNYMYFCTLLLTAGYGEAQ